jgi:ATP-binding protein involved in chromosome partitioning
MAWFTPKELPNNRYYIFGKDGGKAMAERYSIDLLGQVPIYLGIREGGDNGSPAALQQNPQGEAFLEIAETLAKKA